MKSNFFNFPSHRTNGLFFIAPRATHLGSINLVTVHVVDGSKIPLGNKNITSVYFSSIFTFFAFAVWLNLHFNQQKYLNIFVMFIS